MYLLYTYKMDDIEIEYIVVNTTDKREEREVEETYDRRNRYLNRGVKYRCVCKGYFTISSWARHKDSICHRLYIQKLLSVRSDIVLIDKPRFFVIPPRSYTRKKGRFIIPFDKTNGKIEKKTLCF
jgi:hypothetical protein